MEDHESKSVGSVGNYYGGLNVKVEGGKPYWSIENYDGDHWDEIPGYLYEAISRFVDENPNPW